LIEPPASLAAARLARQQSATLARRTAGAAAKQRAADAILATLPAKPAAQGAAAPSFLTDWRVWAGVAALAVVVVVFVMRRRA
jgi:hypothetical protein